MRGFILFCILFPGHGFAACNIVDGKAHGSCAGVTVNQGAAKYFEITSYQSFSGVIAGATVYDSGVLYLSGICNNDIVVMTGGKLVLAGQVKGAVRNEGGIVQIDGQAASLIANGGSTTISGMVSIVSGNGLVTYELGAVVNGRPIE